MSSAANSGGIAIDAMGGDLGPDEVVGAVGLAVASPAFRKNPIPLTLVGEEATLNKALHREGLADHPHIAVHHASEVIGMDEKPLQGIKRKRDSSMVRALELVKDGKARAILSCGNTGSLMAGGTLMIRPLPGIERPALASIIPTRKKRFVLIDAGANPDPSPRQMLQNALLGSNYAKVLLHEERPRVGLLTIGTEEGKGSSRIQEVHEELKRANGVLNYHGLIEGFQVFENRVDVILCDGFVGNIVLKVCESLFKMLKGYVRDELTANPLRKLGAFLSIGAYRSIKEQLNPARYAAAPLLGLKAPVFKAHGSSDRESIAGAIGIIRDSLQFDITEHIRADLRALEGLFDLEAGAKESLEKEVAS